MQLLWVRVVKVLTAKGKATNRSKEQKPARKLECIRMWISLILIARWMNLERIMFMGGTNPNQRHQRRRCRSFYFFQLNHFKFDCRKFSLKFCPGTMEPIFNLKEGGGGRGGGLSTSAWGREFVGMGLNHPTPENFEIYSSYVPHT